MSLTSTIFVCILFILRTCRSEPLAGWSDPANPTEFPFIVSIARKFDITDDNPYGHVCGGALIARRYALTAASCFATNRKESDYYVRVASNDLASGVQIQINKLTTYQSWLRYTHSYIGRIYSENDIAVIELSKRIEPPARPARLSYLSSIDLKGKDVMTAGWGLTFNDIAPQFMYKADLRVMNESQCLQNIRNVSNDWTYAHEENFFCTNGVTLFAVLDEGDKGSPVFFKYKEGDYRIVGVNQKAAPPVDNVVRIAEQQNKHINVHYYFNFIRIVTGTRASRC